MSESITTYGMLSLRRTSGIGMGDENGLNVVFNTQPRGTLKITNEATGATKTIALATLTSGQRIWDRATDDPTATNAYIPGQPGSREFTFEFSGKFDNLALASLSLTPNFIADGSGHGEVSGAYMANGI